MKGFRWMSSVDMMSGIKEGDIDIDRAGGWIAAANDCDDCELYVCGYCYFRLPHLTSLSSNFGSKSHGTVC